MSIPDDLSLLYVCAEFADEASATQMSDYYGDYLSEETHMWLGWSVDIEYFVDLNSLHLAWS